MKLSPQIVTDPLKKARKLSPKALTFLAELGSGGSA